MPPKRKAAAAAPDEATPAPAPLPAPALAPAPVPAPALADTASATVRSVDSYCPLKNGVVVSDHDVMLNQVDLGKNANKFYRIQHIKESNRYYCWTRWGRVGEEGQNSLLGPFATEEEGTKSFAGKFKDKSGNNWENRASFESKKGKYDLIALQDASVTAVTVPAAEQNRAPTQTKPSALDSTTQQLLSFIFDSDMFKDAMASMNLDVKRMPLGTLTEAQIAKGVAVLEKIKMKLNPPADVQPAKKGRKSKKDATEEETAAPTPVTESFQDLSSRFYTIIPHAFPRSVVPPTINTDAQLTQKFEMLAVLNDIAVAQAVSASADATTEQNNKNQENTVLPPHPLDAKYQELEADLNLVSHGDPMRSVIETYIHNTVGHHKISLENVWAVRRHSEDARFQPYLAMDNHRLLWHGTNVAVIAAILKSGLRIMPHSGGRVGRGIYLANELSKSANYTRPGQDQSTKKRIGILFLIEAALGNMNVINRDDPSLKHAPAGFDSVLAIGTNSPDPFKNIQVTLTPGEPSILVPQGPSRSAVAEIPQNTSSFTQDEYLVYHEAQQRIRYMLTFKY